eukprot:726437_1
MMWKPDACTPWRVRNNGLRFSELHFYQDDTFSITIGECASKPQYVRSVAADTFCMANNSILHGSLMGTFGRLRENGSYFNSPILWVLTSSSLADAYAAVLWCCLSRLQLLFLLLN